MPSATGLIGTAGEYYVAAELSRRAWLATVTIKNAPGTDVLAQRRDRRRIVAIQTKTASQGNVFRLNVKCEDPGERDNEWYVFVSLGGLLERASFYVLPRHVVAGLGYLDTENGSRAVVGYTATRGSAISGERMTNARSGPSGSRAT